MALPVLQTVVGIAKETTYGTAVAPTAFIPISGAPKTDEKLKLDADKAWRGSMGLDYGFQPGIYDTTVGYSSYVFPDTVGWALAGVLGDVATTGVSAPYTHTFSLYNGTDGQPPSYTLTDWYVANGRQYPGARFTDASFKISGDGLISYDAAADALPSVSLANTKPTSAFTSVTPLSGWQGAIQIGGVSSVAVLSFECALKRKTTQIHTVAGQQGAQSVFAADLSVTGKMDVIMIDDSQLMNYLNNSQPSLDVNYSVGTGTAAVQFKLHMTKAAYTAATVDRSKEFVQLSISYTAVFNSTDVGASGGYSPIKATLQNALPSGTYK
jgi:hypothetical protein